jgi:hypothetical protein
MGESTSKFSQFLHLDSLRYIIMKCATSSSPRMCSRSLDLFPSSHRSETSVVLDLPGKPLHTSINAEHIKAMSPTVE